VEEEKEEINFFFPLFTHRTKAVR
jgi:hypothetical protein